VKYDFLVVGTGLYGSVFAQQVKEAGRSVKVIEKRAHLGGNCNSYVLDDTQIIVHRYGTHIFHCSARAIWEYVNRFAEFNRYQHRVLTMHKNRVYPMPICLGTLNAFFGLNLEPREVEAFLASKRSEIPSPSNFEEKALSLVGKEIYEAFIKGYTMKQWGRDPKELPASVITRLPFRSSYHDAYFDDYYQGIPLEGYVPMFNRMLAGVPVELEVDFLADREWWQRQAHTVVYTGPIDRFFSYRLGRLRWRSVRFELSRLDMEDFQGTSVMNYADADVPFTRVHEFKHLHRERSHAPRTTVVSREYACLNDDEPCYPVNTEADRAVYSAYQKLAAEEERNVVFGGRLATYRYYDMHEVIGAALAGARLVLGNFSG
jgi:UDP-galactopyranose mutase